METHGSSLLKPECRTEKDPSEAHGAFESARNRASQRLQAENQYVNRPLQVQKVAAGGDRGRMVSAAGEQRELHCNPRSSQVS